MSEFRPLVLASSSVYRRELLFRLHIPFTSARPEVDESALPSEHPEATARRLALAKARAIAPNHPDSLIIGSDQVACVGDRVFGKPGTREGAVAQLQRLRGQTAVFHTALCVLDATSGRTQVRSIPTEVRFRMLTDAEISRYLDREQPYDCAGSAKSEGLGIALLEYIRGDDPNALIGLPLIALSDMLRAEGIDLP
jgi:septum formation protein